MADTLIYNRALKALGGAKEYRYMKNDSGGALAPGDSVIWDTTDATATLDVVTTTTTQDDKLWAGMAIENIADGAMGWFQTRGRTNLLKVDGTTDIAKGDYLSTFTTAKIAAKATAGKGGVFAIAREAYTTNDSAGVIDAELFGPSHVDSSGAALSVLVGDMAAAGTAAANTLGASAAAAPIDHVHALGTHTHSSATTGGATLGDHTSSYVILAETTVPAATNAYIARDNTGDATINAITGKMVHLAVAGTDVVDVAGAAITLRQAVTISTGGITVSAGGATVTGNSTITGDLAVTGSLTFGGNWTVGATLTVDELILDTDGVAPAGTNAYAVSDNTGDLTVNALTGKTFNVAINNTDEYTFSATIADFNGNAADNVGFLILNAATAPAATEVYAVNDNTGDLTLNALTGKTVNIAINGVDEIALGGATYLFNDASNDRDFRVETNSLQYAIYSDGGKDCIVLGDNTDVSTADAMVVVGNVAKTASNNASTAIFKVVATASFTGQGTNAVMSSAWFDEPNLTAGGATITNAATVYISGEPTEGGTGNYGLMVAASIGLIADAKDLVIGAGRDVLMRWSTADADNHAFAIGLGTSKAMHIADAADIATDWNVAAASNPTLYIHGSANPATEYVALSTDETDAHLNAVGANWKFEIGGTLELALTNAALNLAANTLQGGTAASGDLVLQSTSDATKGFITVAATEPGIVVGGTGASVDRATNDGTNAIHLFNGTAPVGAMTNGVTLYSSGGEFYAMDALGNATLNSPHSEDGDYIIYSYSARKNKTVVIHLEKMLNALSTKFPREFVQFMGETAGLVHKGDRVARGLARV